MGIAAGISTATKAFICFTPPPRASRRVGPRQCRLIDVIALCTIGSRRRHISGREIVALTLYHNDMSVCAQKVRLCLAEKDLAYEDKHLNLRGGDQKRPEYLALNPNGYVPTLVHDDFVVCESTVICEYIDEAFPDPALKPADARARARMRGFTKFIDAAIFPATATVSQSIAFHHQYKPEMYETMEKARPGWLANLRQLQKGTENPAFPAAIKRLDKMIADMEKSLAGHGGPR